MGPFCSITTPLIGSLLRYRNQLMEDVSANPNWRFILTTREYILNVAKQRYEAFAQPPIDFTLCVISLSDYTRSVRAKILYNHIYFSDLPKEYKLALLDGRGYEEILSHHNYSPRVVEYMTQSRHARYVPSTLYRREFVDSLNNPARIWDQAFRHQISEAARHILLTLTTLPHETRLEDLEVAFRAFYNYRRNRFGFSTTAHDWDNAMKELDGNFITTQRIGKNIVVSFHSPSVRDFMEQFLATSDSDVKDLIDGACFYEQYKSLWNGVKERRYPGIDRARVHFIHSLESNLQFPSAFVVQKASSDGEITGVQVLSPSRESRADFFLYVVDELQVANKQPLIDSVLDPLEERWKRGTANRQDLMRLLKRLTESGVEHDEASFVAARQCFLTFTEELDHYRAAISFRDAYRAAVTSADWDTLSARFREFAREYTDECYEDDPDHLREIAADLKYVGGELGVDVDRLTEELCGRAEEIETERAENDPFEDYDEDWHRPREPVEDVHSMFDSLRNDLLDG